MKGEFTTDRRSSRSTPEPPSGFGWWSRTSWTRLRDDGAALSLSRPYPLFFLSSHLRQCGATGAIAPAPPCSLPARPPTLTQVTQRPLVSSRDGCWNSQTDGWEGPSQEVRRNNGDSKKNQQQKDKRCRRGLCHCCPSVTASQLQQTASRSHCSSVSPPSLPLSRSPSLSLPLSLARWLPLERRED